VILDQLSSEAASSLREAVEASESISKHGAAWRSKVGTPTGGLHKVGLTQRGTTGFRIDYASGSVYWNSRSGSGTVTSSFKPYFDENGGLPSLLGFPIGPETEAADSSAGTSGTFQRFESTWDYGGELAERLGVACGATVYQSKEHGTYMTRGGIGEYYELSGGTEGPLGFPISEEFPISNGSKLEGVHQDFEGGIVFWSESTGAACIKGEILAHALLMSDIIGFPRADEERASNSPVGTTGVFQRFSPLGGWRGETVVYSCEPHGVRLVSGMINQRFEAEGGPAGPFGFPIGDGTRLGRADGTLAPCEYQAFEGGLIYSNLRSIVVGVTGEAFRLLVHDRSLINKLGAPMTPARRLDDGPDEVQFFENGLISVVSGKARAWLPSD
jgi:uncharacterized protein with LGFP repeats